MNKEFKGFKESCRYLVKDESKFWDTSFEITEITVLEISEKAIKIKYENGRTKWYLKESFSFSTVENLSVVNQLTEEKSKLEWQQDPPKKLMTWYEASEYVKSLPNGWRLPTRGELVSAYDNETKSFGTGCYWSCSVYKLHSNYVWSVDFKYGHVTRNSKGSANYVRCVKDTKEVKQNTEDSDVLPLYDNWEFEDKEVGTLRLE